MPVNLSGLTDAEFRESLAKMAQSITMQANSMTNNLNRHNVQRENPPISNMVDRLADITRINPSIFTRFKTLEDP